MKHAHVYRHTQTLPCMTHVYTHIHTCTGVCTISPSDCGFGTRSYLSGSVVGTTTESRTEGVRVEWLKGRSRHRVAPHFQLSHLKSFDLTFAELELVLQVAHMRFLLADDAASNRGRFHEAQPGRLLLELRWSGRKKKKVAQ